MFSRSRLPKGTVHIVAFCVPSSLKSRDPVTDVHEVRLLLKQFHSIDKFLVRSVIGAKTKCL